MAKAVMSIDPRLVSLVGRKLYSSHPIPIVTRELLQNSVDACRRKGIEPDIKIEIFHNDDYKWLITCTDNGIGMTEDQMENDFLKLGGTKEDGAGQTGGFGIAKAAIMSGEDWSVRSLGNFMNKEMFLRGAEIKKNLRRIDGTIITVLIGEATYRSSLMQAAQMILYSDVSVHLVIESKTYPEIHVDAQNSGINGSIKRKILHDDKWMTVWGTTSLGLSDKWCEVSNPGWNIVRLNGLMQFIRGNQLDIRKNSLFFDIKADTMPDDPAYPFSMSRETLIVDYDNLVRATVDSHNANVLQSMAAVARDIPEEETVTVIPGKLLSGSRDTRYSKHESKLDGFGNKTKFNLKVDTLENKSSHKNAGKTCLLLLRYKKDPNKRKWHAKLLRAWQEIMQLVAESNETFGIGITSDAWMAASRTILDGQLYYVLNPDLTVDEELASQPPEAIILALWATACHEATHAYVDDHNEWFTTTCVDIQADSANDMLRNLKRIAKILQ